MKTKKLFALAIPALALTISGCGKNVKEDFKYDTYDQCIKSYNTSVEQGDYLWHRSVFIHWDKGTTFEESEKFLEDKGFEMDKYFHLSPYYEKILDSSKIEVEFGEEISTACYFNSMKDDTIVNSANPKIYPKDNWY